MNISTFEVIFLLLGFFNYFSHALPEQGKWVVQWNQNSKPVIVTKSLFKDSTVHLSGKCNDPVVIRINWILSSSPCFSQDVTDKISPDNYDNLDDLELHNYNYFKKGNLSVACDENGFTNFETDYNPPIAVGIGLPKIDANYSLYKKSDHDLLSLTWNDGIYYFALAIVQNTTQIPVEITIRIKSSYGFLSAVEWPLLIFYSVMCGLYSIYAIFWLIISACYWKDLLRIQFWIGAVIILGLLEKAFFLSEYETINVTGQSVKGVVLFAEFVSCVKRTLARLLVMVVCIGYGIVKPRLGETLKKVVVLGVLYFVFAILESGHRVYWTRIGQPEHDMWTLIPLHLTDTVIFIVTFTYLVQTIRQMRIRRNVTKFNLYRHFSNMLVLIVCVSVIFMAWVIYAHRLESCVTNWKDLWVDQTFWHVLFSCILLVIMWLWRPSRNNVRYAYSPVLDPDHVALLSDDEINEDAEDIVMENFSSGDLRHKPRKESAAPKKSGTNAAEDELKWIEENIPTTAVENAYPLLDSEDEIENGKVIASKMD